MTIAKKLYLGFGAILAIMLFLFVINIVTVSREYSARSAVAATMSDAQGIENVRYQTHRESPLTGRLPSQWRLAR